ncbi:MAG: hypothetical protein MUD01_13825 [Chloroflexaceae bacterium]|jgi:hypothetical protein|nr:hypothetical protein [Chloroflexaceae bacterium]
MFVQLFGYALAAGVLGTSLAMFMLGGRFQAAEVATYGGAQRPWWFWVLSLTIVALYGFALGDFLTGPKTWAGWLLIIIIPIGWLAKATLVTFNARGRRRVTALAGDATWRKLAMARLPIAVALAGLAALA